MRKTIYTIGIYAICLSVFTFCYATPNDDIVPINAIVDLSSMEGKVRDQRAKVQDAWTVVNKVSAKWEEATDEARTQNLDTAVSNFLSDGTLLTAARLLGFLESDAEKELTKLYENLSLMDLYSDMLELLKGEIDWFYNITVPLYNSAHKHAETTVNSHHTNQHDDASPSNVNHTVPDWEEKTCRDDLPEFNCLGSSSCSDTFSTPSEAYNTHRELCGSEEVHRNSPVPGDGIFYYTCNADGVARHGVRNCQKWFWYNDVRETRCNLPYRVCTNPEFSHRNAWWSSSTTHESRAEEISDYFEVVGSHLNDPVDPYGTYRAAHLGDPSPTPITETDNSPNCDYCTTGGCSACPITYACGNHSGPPSESNSHSMQASCLVSVTQDGGLAYCTVTSFYACSSHTHTFPTFSCGRSACTQQVADPNRHRIWCINGHEYWSCDTTALYWHQTRGPCTRRKLKSPGVRDICGESWALCYRNGQSCRDYYGSIRFHEPRQ